MTETRRRVSRLRVSQWFAIISVVLVVVTLAGLVAGVIAIVRLSDARDLVVNHLDPAATSALRLSNALINEETGVRGYALAGQDSFLEPYRAGRRDELSAVAQLRARVHDTDAGQVLADVDRVEQLANTWRGSYARPTIRLVRERGPEAVRQRQTDGGKAQFDLVRAALRRQQMDIAAARTDAKRELDAAADFLAGSFIAIVVLLLLGVVAVTIALRRTVARPVGELGAGVRRVRQGEFEHELIASGPRDLAQLSDDVDAMRRRILAELAQVQAAQRRVERQALELERSNAELEQFAYVASHDLQEPLRKVASFCQLLEQRYRGQLDERADQYIDFAVDGAKRMQQLINDLLAFSRVGRLTNKWEPVELDEALEHALANLETAIAENGANVIADPLPTVSGEASLLVLVFQNLIGNAVKFSGERPARVHVGVQRIGDEWLISCADDGIGIEPQYAERVFVIFQRLHPKQDYPGTGIGLALCRKIVEYHGGRIWLETEATPGTVFQFTLPALEETP